MYMYMYINKLRVICYSLQTEEEEEEAQRRALEKIHRLKKGNVPREARPFPKTRVVVHDNDEPKKSGVCQYICTVHVTETNKTWLIIIQKFPCLSTRSHVP